MTWKKCMFTSLAIYAATLVFIWFSGPAHSSQQPCLPIPAMLQNLAKYNETVRFTGFNSKNDLTKFWANDKTGTWSITMEQYGIMCLMSAGTDFKTIKQGVNL